MGDKTSKEDMKKAAKAFSQLGASKGGKARANVLSKSERTEIARNAAMKRWGKKRDSSDPPKPQESKIKNEEKSDDEMPYSLLPGYLNIGDLELECHVLDDHRRVFTQRAMVRILSGGRESGNLRRYLERNPLIEKDSFVGPIIQFTIPGSPQITANGYEATTLIDICDKYLEADAQGLLRSSQRGLVVQAGILMRASAKTGIIALVDEATGFEKIKAERTLQLKFQAFIADDIQEWARLFPEEFWYELARLEGVRYSPRSRPLRWGKYVMMFVYDAIDKDVGKELRRKNPNPQFNRNHHQWLKKFGRDKVHDQLMKVIAIMQTCDDMDQFRHRFAKAFTKTPLQLDFSDIVS